MRAPTIGGPPHRHECAVPLAKPGRSGSLPHGAVDGRTRLEPLPCWTVVTTGALSVRAYRRYRRWRVRLGLPHEHNRTPGRRPGLDATPPTEQHPGPHTVQPATRSVHAISTERYRTPGTRSPGLREAHGGARRRRWGAPALTAPGHDALDADVHKALVPAQCLVAVAVGHHGLHLRVRALARGRTARRRAQQPVGRSAAARHPVGRCGSSTTRGLRCDRLGPG